MPTDVRDAVLLTAENPLNRILLPADMPFMDILTKEDTLFGSIAYQNKLISQDELNSAVRVVQNNPGMRLGDVLVQKGYITQDEVRAILDIQRKQLAILAERIAPTPPTSPPLPSGATAAKATAALPALPEKLEHLADYLAYARAAGASDLHISAGEKPFLRLHSRVQPLDVPPLAADRTEHLLFEVLSTQQQSLLVADRSLETCIQVPDYGRYRASFVKQRLGWDGAFRVIRNKAPTFEELGLPDCLRRLTEYQQGLVLLTGPANSGKTTTLAALIDLVNATRDDHVISIERPIEYVHVSQKCQVTQREAGLHTESFATALRAALREDPDIIMVGELSDLETLSMAITASETGHLVFGTLHTTSAARTLSRVLDGFPSVQQAQVRMMLSESLRGVVSQQLVPRKDGQGVALALEIMFVTPAVSALIRDNQPFQIPSIIQTSRKIGMCRLDDSLAALLNQGLIDADEARDRAENKAAFEKRL